MTRLTNEAMALRLEEQLTLTAGDTLAGEMGLALADCRWEAGEVCFALNAEPWMCNLRGAVHGGALSALFDHAFRAVVRAAGGEAMLASLQLNYLGGVPPRVPLLLRVRAEHMGRSLKFLSGELLDSRNTNRPLTCARAVCAAKL